MPYRIIKRSGRVDDIIFFKKEKEIDCSQWFDFWIDSYPLFKFGNCPFRTAHYFLTGTWLFRLPLFCDMRDYSTCVGEDKCPIIKKRSENHENLSENFY